MPRHKADAKKTGVKPPGAKPAGPHPAPAPAPVAGRLDQELVMRGLAPSRSRARDMILRGLIKVAGKVEIRPGAAIAAAARIEIPAATANYVSRGAEKLIAALEHFRFDPAGRVALDLGASTGGFSEVLLARGATRVYAVDVGHGQLHPRLAADARLVELSRTDARLVTPRLVPGPIGAIVADLSFISLTKAMAPALLLARPGAWLVALVKPQFEAGRKAVGKGGIVRDPEARAAAAASVATWIAEQPGWRVVGTIASPIAGGDGNAEILLGAICDA